MATQTVSKRKYNALEKRHLKLQDSLDAKMIENNQLRDEVRLVTDQRNDAKANVRMLEDANAQMAGELQQARATPRKETVGALSADTRPITNHVASMPTINVNEGGVVNITNNNA